MSLTNVTIEEEFLFDFPNALYFWFYLLLLIPAILCSIFVFSYVLTHRILRPALYNHIIIAIVVFALIYQTTTFPWMLNYYRLNGQWERSSMFCRIWGFLDWSLYTVNAMLFAWSTIERYLLIFHDRWISTPNRRFFCHYLPMISIIFYAFGLYSIVFFFPPCAYFVPVVNTLCLTSCLKDDPRFVSFETLFNQVIPVLIILIFATLLVLRVVWQKYRFGRIIQWRRHRKMIVQSISVSVLYLICIFPLAVVYLVRMCGFDSSTTYYFKIVFELFSYLPALLLPMVIGLSLTEIRVKFVNTLRWKRQRQIFPTLTTRPMENAN